MIKKILLIHGAALLLSQAVWAQAANQTSRQFRRSTATVIFASLGGGVLGLSTLSFYGRPEEHTGNITTGAALGLIGGLIYVAMENSKPVEPSFSKSNWIPEPTPSAKNRAGSKSTPLFAMQFSF